MISTIKKVILGAVFITFSLQSSAWGLLGHRIVAEVADSYLTKKAKRNIASILGNESLAMTSNWPDFIKSDPSFSYLNTWHYINLKEGLTEADIEKYLASDTVTDAYTKINLCVEKLKNRNVMPMADQVFYLRLLIHIVGDIHQPMHVGRFEDLGGNKVKILWFSTPTNLHALWDEKLIEFQQLSYTEYTKAINFTTKDERKKLQAEPVSKWIIDSYFIAQKIYGDIKQPDQRLDYKYNFNYLKTLNDQLLKGGVHLGGLLNDIFG